MNDINAAQRLRVAALEKAEAAKIRVVKEAEADAEAKYLHGSGVARQRQVRLGSWRGRHRLGGLGPARGLFKEGGGSSGFFSAPQG